MAILIKTGPLKPDAKEGSVIRLKERAYREPIFGARDRAFIWVDASTGVSELHAEAMVLEEPSLDDPGKSDTLTGVKLVLTRLGPAQPLTYLADIRPHRDDPRDALMHGLAEIICRHAHRKITSLTPAQETFLLSRFEP